ncbi:MAG: RNA-binding S4 domain-containing protein [Nannocystaceae bacterium]
MKVDGASVTASKHVRPGQTIHVLTPGGPRIIELVKLLDKRVGASLAQALYIDHTPTPEQVPVERAVPRRERGSGRPDKRERRALLRLRGRS